MEEALDCYLKGLEVDDLAEEFYQGLMNCYHRLDRIADVRAIYQRYRKTFSTLRLEPSTKIETVYQENAFTKIGESLPSPYFLSLYFPIPLILIFPSLRTPIS